MNGSSIHGLHRAGPRVYETFYSTFRADVIKEYAVNTIFYHSPYTLTVTADW
jgi:hypothetical protein